MSEARNTLLAMSGGGSQSSAPGLGGKPLQGVGVSEARNALLAMSGGGSQPSAPGFGGKSLQGVGVSEARNTLLAMSGGGSQSSAPGLGGKPLQVSGRGTPCLPCIVPAPLCSNCHHFEGLLTCLHVEESPIAQVGPLRERLVRDGLALISPLLQVHSRCCGLHWERPQCLVL